MKTYSTPLALMLCMLCLMLFGQQPTLVDPSQIRGGTGTVANKIATSTMANLPIPCDPSEIRFVSDANIDTGLLPYYACMLRPSLHPTPAWYQLGYQGDISGMLNFNCTKYPCELTPTRLIVGIYGANDFRGSNDFSKATRTAPAQIGATDPINCDSDIRQQFYNYTEEKLKVCVAPGVWKVLAQAQ